MVPLQVLLTIKKLGVKFLFKSFTVKGDCFIENNKIWYTFALNNSYIRNFCIPVKETNKVSEEESMNDLDIQVQYEKLICDEIWDYKEQFFRGELYLKRNPDIEEDLDQTPLDDCFDKITEEAILLTAYKTENIYVQTYITQKLQDAVRKYVSTHGELSLQDTLQEMLLEDSPLEYQHSVLCLFRDIYQIIEDQ